MFSYSVYGLRLQSELAVPEFAAADAQEPPDVRIRVGRVDRHPSDTAVRGCFHATPTEAYLFWEMHGTYVVRNGREIVVEPSADEHRVPRLPLLGVALGILLWQRGRLTFHASAVTIGGAAVAFVGPKGAGKSTIAAALYARGHALATDDVAVIAFDDAAASQAPRRPVLVPGFPALKLWPATVTAIGADPEDFPRLLPVAEKRVFATRREFSQAPLPFRGLYTLADGPNLRAERLPPQKQFAEMMGHSYAQRFLGSTGTTPEHFRQCMQLADAVPVFRLERPRGLSGLPELAAFVEQHAAQRS